MNKSLVLNKNNYDKELKMNRQKIDYANIYGGIDTLEVCTETPTAKARWVLEYLNFQYITNDIKTSLFLQDFY